MLATEIRIANIKRQREFIKEQLQKLVDEPNSDGSCTYRYVGQVLPEVIKYFESEGFDVTLVKSDVLTALCKGLPVYLFTLKGYPLTSEEMKEAESVVIPDYEEESEEHGIPRELLDLLRQ